CFVPILDPEVLAETLSSFYSSMERNLARQLRWRLGLEGTDEDPSQLSALVFEAAKASQIGWSRLFHDLYGGHSPDEFADPAWRDSDELVKLANYASSLSPRQSKTAVQAMRAAPLISLEIDVVERIWAPIAASDDWSEFTQTLQDIRAFGRRLRT
ncbi:MAG: protein adenylyltransferase SelO family protein, partial [Pseudomonadota bacterium]|nr:protein adenylyltransferase SelO family protein [Pseudomonadota bacterium]